MRSIQAPIYSRFTDRTTASEALALRDLKGLVAIVTGGHTGIGYETTRALSEAGASVIVGARSPENAHVGLKSLPNVEVQPLDLADPRSIDTFAARFVWSGRALHMLINNAGIMALPLTRDGRGFEMHLAVNHLGHFHLTTRLWPALKKAKGARVVTVSARDHARAQMDFDDPQFEKRPYDKWLAYGQSKTANALFSIAADARGAEHNIRAFSVNPGVTLTSLMRSLSDQEVQEMRKAYAVFKSTEQAAATSVWCATSRQLDGMGGVYCEDVDIALPVAADAKHRWGVRPWANDPVAADRLWKLSESWTGATLGS